MNICQWIVLMESVMTRDIAVLMSKLFVQKSLNSIFVGGSQLFSKFINIYKYL